MIRRLFTVASVLSLLLCAATAILWFRSFWRPDSKAFYYHGMHWQIVCDRGRFRFENQPQLQDELDAFRESQRAWDEQTRAALTEVRRANKARYDYDADDPHRQRAFQNYVAASEHWIWMTQHRPQWMTNLSTLRVHSIPHAVLFCATAILPVIALAASLRRQWKRCHGLCLSCGYDLRASIERCPECGSPIMAIMKPTK